MNHQATDTALLVRPACFGANAETAGTNAFQNHADEVDGVADRARVEFDAAVGVLRAAGVTVVEATDDPSPPRPDAVFPNNWFSTHEDGTLVLYPMCAPNRRRERRLDVLETVLREQGMRCERLLDLSHHEADGRFLEGTGSLVLDRPGRIAYACLSGRTERSLVEEWCSELGYRPFIFGAIDDGGRAIYHTNVMLAVGTDWAVCAADTLPEDRERRSLLESLADGGRTVVEITGAQMSAFAGNVLELRTAEGPRILASRSAYAAFTPAQRAALQAHADFVVVDIPTIERVGGGSARCMVAELFLPRRSP